MRWSLVSTGWTRHHWHQDSNGFATMVNIKSGQKWWYIGTPRSDMPVSQQDGGIDQLLKGFDLNGSNVGRLDVDVVVLQPRDWLPHTLHAVVTPKPTVVSGGHFLCKTTMRATCFALYDDFIAAEYITNIDHFDASTMLLSRIMLFYHQSFLKKTKTSRVKDHLPNLLDFEEVVDLFTFCNLMELFGVLCPWQYEPEYNPTDAQSRRRAMKNRKRARQIKNWFFANHRLRFNGISVSPDDAINYLDHSFLGQQASALRNYKHQAVNDTLRNYIGGNTIEGKNPKTEERAVDAAITRCLQTSPAFPYYKPDSSNSFNWIKPRFTIETLAEPTEREVSLRYQNFGKLTDLNCNSRQNHQWEYT
ncbi:hypothetical protein DXG01_010548 [Tephrocybe rancida]|nr:hypothetical protein DXG01_010548 [Tephrocybe rancida]